MSILVNPALGARQKRYPAYKGVSSAYYVDLTIDRTEVDGDVTDFPLCIQGNEMPAGFWSHVGDGTDILVTDVRSGRVLRKEIELLDKTGGSEKLAVHSKVPFIGTGYDQVLRIYYGGSMTQADTDWAVWDSGYEFVSHMADYNAGTQIKDSTKNRNHGTKGEGAAAPTEVAGTVGRAQQFVAANSQYIVSANAIGVVTEYSLLVMGTGLGNGMAIANTYVGGQFVAVDTFGTGSVVRAQFRSSVGVTRACFGAATWGVGTRVVEAVKSGANLLLYTDGVALSRTGDTGTVANGVLYIGKVGVGTPYHLTGLIDELRLSLVARSAEWIALEHKTLLTPTTLYGISAEVAL